MQKVITLTILALMLTSCAPSHQVKMEFDPDPLCRFKTGRTSIKAVEDILDGNLLKLKNSIKVEIPYRVPTPKDLPKGSIVYICSVR